ncbi:hypothetical protein Aperf_G00000055645 [Anoplocephala perfoliata]
MSQENNTPQANNPQVDQRTANVTELLESSDVNLNHRMQHGEEGLEDREPEEDVNTSERMHYNGTDDSNFRISDNHSNEYDPAKLDDERQHRGSLDLSHFIQSIDTAVLIRNHFENAFRSGPTETVVMADISSDEMPFTLDIPSDIPSSSSSSYSYRTHESETSRHSMDDEPHANGLNLIPPLPPSLSLDDEHDNDDEFSTSASSIDSGYCTDEFDDSSHSSDDHADGYRFIPSSPSNSVDEVDLSILSDSGYSMYEFDDSEHSMDELSLSVLSDISSDFYTLHQNLSAK